MAGAHYRTLLMFFMFQKKTKKGGHPPWTHAFTLYTLHYTPYTSSSAAPPIVYGVCVRVRSSQIISRALVGKMRILSAAAIISASEG